MTARGQGLWLDRRVLHEEGHAKKEEAKQDAPDRAEAGRPGQIGDEPWEARRAGCRAEGRVPGRTVLPALPTARDPRIGKW